MSDTHASMMAELGGAARTAARALASLPDRERRGALETAAAALRQTADRILAANAEDMDNARERDLPGALLDRLRLDEPRVAAMADGLETVAALPDPVGRVLADWNRPNGLNIQRVAVPIGVIGVIYESRPNVTADAAALCLKAGNAVILRGGSEAVHSNRAIHAVIQRALAACAIDPATVQLIPTQDRGAVGAMLTAHQWLDMVVPRGGKSLVARVQREARVPVLAHLDGNNHLYLHASADAEMARAVVVNAKMRRTGICGALETLLIDRQRLDLLPGLVDRLTEAGCHLRGDAESCALDARIEAADDSDWEREYLDAILALRVVDGPEDALAHIARYGSGHTDGLVADDQDLARDFLSRLDSAIAVHNTSTQFADGGEFGFGAEIGIATGRLHARGPVGVDQLTTFQYRVYGSGQTRD